MAASTTPLPSKQIIIIPEEGIAPVGVQQRQRCNVRAVIALNNMAVRLFAETHCYRKAHLVIKDAVQALRRTDYSTQSGSNSVEDQLQRASRWLIAPEASSKKSRLPIQVFSDNPSSRVSFNHQNFLDHDIVARFIRIHVNDYEEPNADRVLAIATYNYGVSFQCQSEFCAPSSTRRMQLLAVAAKVLRTSSNFVHFIGGEVEEERVLFVSLLIETALVQTLVPLGQFDEARHRLISLKRAGRKIDAYLHVFSLVTASGTEVAAAA